MIVYPSSGSGAWEAALVNTLSPGDRVLFGANGQFAAGWQKVAAGLGLTVEELQGTGAAQLIFPHLRAPRR